MAATRVQQHVFYSYLNFRFGIALLAFCLPLLLWADGALQGVSLQDSISAYYHVAPSVSVPLLPSTRDIFVGMLVTIGFILVAYRGYTPFENVLLNLAGALIVGVAFVPMQYACEPNCSAVSLHGVLAVGFFICIGLVCTVGTSASLKAALRAKALTPAEVSAYKRWYALWTVLMWLSPLIAFALSVWAGRTRYVFFVEVAGISAFVGYWVTKGVEMASTHVEHSQLVRDVQGAVKSLAEKRWRDAFVLFGRVQKSGD